jgi:hypothetical protein
MIARFPGKCARTGHVIRPGDVITFTAARKAVLVTAAAPAIFWHDSAAPAGRAIRPGDISDTVQFGDRVFYRNNNGRCEDAPCCGCCTI